MIQQALQQGYSPPSMWIIPNESITLNEHPMNNCKVILIVVVTFIIYARWGKYSIANFATKRL